MLSHDVNNGSGNLWLRIVVTLMVLDNNLILYRKAYSSVVEGFFNIFRSILCMSSNIRIILFICHFLKDLELKILGNKVLLSHDCFLSSTFVSYIIQTLII